MNDKNDAFGIAQMMRANLYKEVHVKSDNSCELKVLLGARNQLMASKQQIMGTVRGLLKIYGLKIPAKTPKFVAQVREAISVLNSINVKAIESTLPSLESVQRSIDDLDNIISEYCKNDEDCKLLMTIPGVGVITAITYKSGLDDPKRFEDSDTVGAYMGPTPRQYASGEINRQGGISKMGPKQVRTLLYEAAQSLLIVSKKNKIKRCGMKIMRKKGNKKAIVAVARKLAFVMHRMLINRTEFCC
ncbi:MAG: IS110 family transposase [Rickettsiaceae bacterium]|nr:IS110 family transposase [Rickettsiaceae bacterium]